MPTKTNTLLTIAAIVLLVAATIAFAAREEKEAPSPTPTPVEAPGTAIPSAESLMQVAVPDGTPSQTLQYTGFALSFNTLHAQPNYVAWELTADEAAADAATRKGQKFTTDPRAQGCPAAKDYANSGYSKGHMCPAADMKWSQQAMTDCFSLTNISPQKAALNTGAWGSLEKACRRWAARDSAIIIICGPVLADRLTQKIGRATPVSIPRRFYKVILAPYANPPRAIAFIMPNAAVDGGIQAAATTVDAVEQATGLDFFYALPDSIENEIEAQCNFPLWNNRPPRKH